MQALIREYLSGGIAEQAVHPEETRAVVLEIVVHGEAAEAIGMVGPTLVLHELPKRRRVTGIDPFIRVNLDDPLRVQVGRGGQQSVAVCRVIPAAVTAPGRGPEQDFYERTGSQEVRGVIAAPIVQGRNGIAIVLSGFKEGGEVDRGVAGRQQADDSGAPPHHPLPGKPVPSESRERRQDFRALDNDLEVLGVGAFAVGDDAGRPAPGYGAVVGPPWPARENVT